MNINLKKSYFHQKRSGAETHESLNPFTGCIGIEPSWEHIESENFNFPVPQDTLITVNCSRKYVNLGTKTVKCDQGTQYVGRPSCVKPGKFI